ncbi:MAG: hypothetical protein AAFQ94_28905 [Bacteroidota bacterium]
MKNFLNLLKLDVLQRIRTYRFFVMVVLGLYLAAGFVPAPDANYSTINLGEFRPIYNSVWVGALTAMMSSILICMVGFFLIDGAIGKDRNLKVDIFIRSRAISRRKYLFLKAWSNSVMLCIIILFIFLMALIMFFIRREAGEFSLLDFLIPFALVSVPAAIFTGHLSVILEALTGKYAVVRIIIFLLSLAAIFPTIQNVVPGDFTYFRDTLGLSNFFGQIRLLIEQQFGATLSGISMGYQFFDRPEQTNFVIDEFKYPLSFVISRPFIVLMMTGLVALSALLPEMLFRNSLAIPVGPKKESSKEAVSKKQTFHRPVNVSYSQNFVRLTLIDIKALLTFRKQKINWLIAAIWGVSIFVPLSVSHSYLLPLMVLFSSNKIAALGARVYQTQIIQYSRVFPRFYSRQLFTHLMAVLTWLLLLALPVMLRLLIDQSIHQILHVITGLLFIGLLAQLLGAINKSARLFEIILVLITYFLINGLPFFDYLGATGDQNANKLLMVMLIASPLIWLLHYLWMKNKVFG